MPYGQQALREWQSSEYPVASRKGQQALQINPDSWQHLQGVHFVFHFANKSTAVRGALEAEFYLGKIREELDLDNSDTTHKSNIFIFEREEDWKAFVKTAVLDPWTGGFFDGLDLFYWRKTGIGVLYSDSTLPHEIAHRVVYEKFPQGQIPLAFNEGFAEYEARKLAFRFLRPRGYDVKVISKRVRRDKFIPAAKLVAMTTYPSGGEAVQAFYDESERLVNFLTEKQAKGTFMALLQSLAEGKSFQISILQIYSESYSSLEQFERAFADYAILPEK